MGTSSYEDFLNYSYSDFLGGTINFSSSEKNNMEISFENGKLSYNYIMEYSDISPYDTINETDSDIYTENYFENLTISENSNYSCNEKERWSNSGLNESDVCRQPSQCIEWRLLRWVSKERNLAREDRHQILPNQRYNSSQKQNERVKRNSPLVPHSTKSIGY